MRQRARSTTSQSRTLRLRQPTKLYKSSSSSASQRLRWAFAERLGGRGGEGGVAFFLAAWQSSSTLRPSGGQCCVRNYVRSAGHPPARIAPPCAPPPARTGPGSGTPYTDTWADRFYGHCIEPGRCRIWHRNTACKSQTAIRRLPHHKPPPRYVAMRLEINSFTSKEFDLPELFDLIKKSPTSPERREHYESSECEET